jgi:heme-degrading monooxygenase HmoA
MIKVMVEWRCKPGKMKALEGMIQDLRAKAMRKTGYISGETLKGVDDPNAYMVVSTWTRPLAWENWERSRERQEIIQLIAPNVIEDSCVRVYVPYSEEA